MRAIFFILFSFSLLTLSAQQIRILDKKTGDAVEDVFIFDLGGNISTNSDKEGVFLLSIFEEGSYISFQHPAYQSATYSYSDLLKVNEILLEEKILQMNELVISANKWEQSTADIPNSIAVISPLDIELQNPQTAADILEQSGKIFVQRSQAGGGSPMIRGFAANSVLIVVDGVRMNNAIFRSGNLQNVVSIDPNTLQNTEVIFGPGSVIYGSDALGGVMDFHTISPDFTDEKKVGAVANLRFASANLEKSGHLNWRVTNRKVSFFTGWSYNSFDHLMAGSKRKKGFEDFGKREWYQERIAGTDTKVVNEDPDLQIPTSYDQWNGIAKLRFKLGGNRNLTYGFYYSNTTDIPRYDRLIRESNGIPSHAEWHYGPQQWIRNSIQYNNFNKSKIYDGLKLTLARQDFRESRNTRDFGNPILTAREESVKVYSINFDLDKSINESSDLYYGAEFVTNSVTSTAYTQNIDNGQQGPASTRYPDGGSTFQTSALYFNLSNGISDKLIINGGLRLNQVSLQAQINDQVNFDFPFDKISLSQLAINGNAGLVFKPGRDWKFDLLLSTGFRAPNVDDAGKLFDSEPGNVLVPNPNLEPEKAYNIDVGISKVIKSKVKLEITGFYTIVDDIITRRNFLFNGQDSILYDNVLSRVQALQNVQGGFIYGASIFFKGTISDDLSLTSSFTITNGEDTDGNSVRHAAPSFGKTSLQWQKDKILLDVYSIYNGPIAFEDLAPSEQNKAYLYTQDGSLSWVTFNVKARYELGKKLFVFGGIENILDLHYRPYSSGISAAGRNFIVSLKYSIN